MMNKSFLAKFKWWAANITTGETQQQNLNGRTEGLILVNSPPPRFVFLTALTNCQ
jgi:hypothetical protein